MLRRTLTVFAILAVSLTAQAQKERHLAFHYAFTVKDVPAGKEVRVWFPLAQSDTHQDVAVLGKEGDLKLRQAEESEYDNLLFYAEEKKSTRVEYKFAVDYDVIRREHVELVNGKLAPDARPEKASKLMLARYLQPDRLVPVTGLPAQLAVGETKGATTQLDKAHAIYEYVFRTMRYDKSGTGWGHGDTLWACDSKRGNCTDFHSVFLSMARSQQIPSRFEIGFPLPADKHSAEIPGYHCWAEFYVDQMGWIPVDISEAWKHPDKHDYFFGAHDANRVQFSTGRDLKLSPPQAGPPLNYLVYPYVEVDGREYSNVSIHFSFQDVEAPAAKTAALQ
ncbi:MAG TPA: transglutaminase domain-containing protein [Terriglobales bacterium]|nr:transglutaminase domain-containing protein [Terriglobales bacterium]